MKLQGRIKITIKTGHNLCLINQDIFVSSRQDIWYPLLVNPDRQCSYQSPCHYCIIMGLSFLVTKPWCLEEHILDSHVLAIPSNGVSHLDFSHHSNYNLCIIMTINSTISKFKSLLSLYYNLITYNRSSFILLNFKFDLASSTMLRFWFCIVMKINHNDLFVYLSCWPYNGMSFRCTLWYASYSFLALLK